MFKTFIYIAGYELFLHFDVFLNGQCHAYFEMDQMGIILGF